LTANAAADYRGVIFIAFSSGEGGPLAVEGVLEPLTNFLHGII
jgi:hypothetical protein